MSKKYIVIHRISYKFTSSTFIIQTNVTSCVFVSSLKLFIPIAARAVFVELVVEGADGDRPSRGVVFARADWTANWINRLCTPAHALNRMKLSYHGSIPSYTRPVFFPPVPNSLSLCLPHSLTRYVCFSLPLCVPVSPSLVLFSVAIARFVSFRYLHNTTTI